MARNDSTTPHRRSPKSKVCQTRYIKVNEYTYVHKLKDDHIGAGRPVPLLQVRGYWLKQAGFEINTPVKVRVMDGCLVLTTQRQTDRGFQLFERLSEQDQAIVARTMASLANKKTNKTY